MNLTKRWKKKNEKGIVKYTLRTLRGDFLEVIAGGESDATLRIKLAGGQHIRSIIAGRRVKREVDVANWHDIDARHNVVAFAKELLCLPDKVTRELIDYAYDLTNAPDVANTSDQLDPTTIGLSRLLEMVFVLGLGVFILYLNLNLFFTGLFFALYAIFCGVRCIVQRERVAAILGMLAFVSVALVLVTTGFGLQ